MIGIVQLNVIASEKEAGLLSALRAMGLYESAYWLSWLTVITGSNTLITLLMMVTGQLEGTFMSING